MPQTQLPKFSQPTCTYPRPLHPSPSEFAGGRDAPSSFPRSLFSVSFSAEQSRSLRNSPPNTFARKKLHKQNTNKNDRNKKKLTYDPSALWTLKKLPRARRAALEVAQRDAARLARQLDLVGGRARLKLNDQGRIKIEEIK